MPWLTLLIGGLIAGVLAGLLGIGGGAVLVPILVMADFQPVEAVATSSLAIIITALSGTLQNWRMGLLQPRQVLSIGLPAILATQLGVWFAAALSGQILLIAFGCLMLLNLYLLSLRQRLLQKATKDLRSPTSLAQPPGPIPPLLPQIATGTLAGAIAGLLGVGGGAIMVPLQMLLLQRPIKPSIQISLAVVVMTAIASTVGHSINGYVRWLPGLILGFGGLVTAQLSTRLLPKLPDRIISQLFRGFLLISALYSFWRAWSA